MSEYEAVQRGPLRLKGDSGGVSAAKRCRGLQPIFNKGFYSCPAFPLSCSAAGQLELEPSVAPITGVQSSAITSLLSTSELLPHSSRGAPHTPLKNYRVQEDFGAHTMAKATEPVAETVAPLRKKKKEKEKNKIVDQTVSSKNQEEKKRALDKRTPAQLAYEKTQEKRQIERILKKASKTHKQRVEDFNRHLDTLTEHYDIPKVSWTK